MENCVFCKIVSGEVPSKKIFEDEQVYAFYDIAPAAPVHFLVVPKIHSLTGAQHITDKDGALIGHIFAVIARLAQELKLDGYRVVTNNGEKAGQTVHHLHFHVLSGQELGPMA